MNLGPHLIYPIFSGEALSSASPAQGILCSMGSGRRTFWSESRSVSWRAWKQSQTLKDKQNLILWTQEKGAFQAQGSLLKGTGRKTWEVAVRPCLLRAVLNLRR